jgi:hypothetical protein
VDVLKKGNYWTHTVSTLKIYCMFLLISASMHPWKCIRFEGQWNLWVFGLGLCNSVCFNQQEVYDSII